MLVQKEVEIRKELTNKNSEGIRALECLAIIHRCSKKCDLKSLCSICILSSVIGALSNVYYVLVHRGCCWYP